jgi:hypothetical protein
MIKKGAAYFNMQPLFFIPVIDFHLNIPFVNMFAQDESEGH